MRIGLLPSCFIFATASTASPLTSRVLGHANGVCSVEENTTLGAPGKLGHGSVFVRGHRRLRSRASDWAANPDIRRYVFAPIKIV